MRSETQVVGQRQRLDGQTGDGVHHAVLVKVQPEVVARLCTPSDDVLTLRNRQQDCLTINGQRWC